MSSVTVRGSQGRLIWLLQLNDTNGRRREGEMGTERILYPLEVTPCSKGLSNQEAVESGMVLCSGGRDQEREKMWSMQSNSIALRCIRGVSACPCAGCVHVVPDLCYAGPTDGGPEAVTHTHTPGPLASLLRTHCGMVQEC